jgi:hypothetical protein
MSIRPLYEKYGVENYYQNFGHLYKNPHENEIIKLLKQSLFLFNKNDYILDLSCGNGIITKYLLGNDFINIKGCDPYLYEIYQKETGCECYKLNFNDLINNQLNESFNIAICSFALHLCEENKLYNFLSSLKYNNQVKLLIIISPTKKPNIDKYFSLDILNFIEKTINGKNIYMKIYKLSGLS